MAENKKCGLGTFVAGAAVGVGLGLLFAPKSGAETRKELKEKMDELLQNIKEIKMDDVKENLQNKIEEIKEDLADLDKEKVLSIAREKAEQIKEKLDELTSVNLSKIENENNTKSNSNENKLCKLYSEFNNCESNHL